MSSSTPLAPELAVSNCPLTNTSIFLPYVPDTAVLVVYDKLYGSVWVVPAVISDEIVSVYLVPVPAAILSDIVFAA